MSGHSILSLAVASGKVGFVYLEEDQLLDWGVSVKAAKSSTEIAGFVQARISALQPHIVVTERCEQACRKGAKTRDLIRAMAETASHNAVLDVAVARPHRHAHKYDEALALAKQFTELEGYLPSRKRRIFDHESRNMIMFEALALALEVRDGGPTGLAAAMG